jgi:hypothetical protein
LVRVAPTATVPLEETMKGFHSSYASRSVRTDHTCSGVASISIEARMVYGTALLHVAYPARTPSASVDATSRRRHRGLFSRRFG